MHYLCYDYEWKETVVCGETNCVRLLFSYVMGEIISPEFVVWYRSVTHRLSRTRCVKTVISTYLKKKVVLSFCAG